MITMIEGVKHSISTTLNHDSMLITAHMEKTTVSIAMEWNYMLNTFENHAHAAKTLIEKCYPEQEHAEYIGAPTETGFLFTKIPSWIVTQ